MTIWQRVCQVDDMGFVYRGDQEGDGGDRTWAGGLARLIRSHAWNRVVCSNAADARLPIY